jgi:hypothetical protein
MNHQSVLLLADAGVPMIFLTFPAMVMLLLPIILVEAWFLRKWLALGAWEAAKTSAIANIASTLAGVPAAWAVMLCVEFGVGLSVAKIASLSRASEKWNSPIARVVTTLLSAAWLGPDERNLYWMVPVAVLGLMVPTFFASVWIETFIVENMAGGVDEDPSNPMNIRSAVRNANLISYCLLAVGAVVWLLYSLLNPPRRNW